MSGLALWLTISGVFLALMMMITLWCCLAVGASADDDMEESFRAWARRSARDDQATIVQTIVSAGEHQQRREGGASGV